MARFFSEIDPNVVDGLYAASDGSSSGALSDAYLQADQRGGTGSNGKPSLTMDEAAVQLTRDQVSWADNWGQAASVTYAFRSTAPSHMPDDTSGFSRFNAAQITATERALQSWSDVANITFTRVGSGTSGSSAYSNSATILFGNYSSGAEGAAAFAYYPYSYANSSVDGDVWVNSSLSYNANPQMFNYGQLALIHEIGHAIGLSHPGDYNAGPDVDITYANSAEYYEDSMQYTVMSYFYETYTGASYGSPYPATVMLDDIAAAQRLYGANMSTRTGDTVYGFNSTAGRAWFSAGSSSSALIFAVWDAGGTDTFDFSGYASNQKIDLRQGNFSDVGGLIGNVAVARNVVIENAIGGAGADTIIGNTAANVLKGAGGADTLTGGAGADTFVFTQGGGADIVTDFTVGVDKLDASAFGAYVSIGQSGGDTLVTFVSGVTALLKGVSASTVTANSFVGVNAPTTTPSPPPASSGLTLEGTAAGDTLIGGLGDDILNGYAGGDRLDGGAGADTMKGGADNDTYYVDNAGDVIEELASGGLDTVHSSVSYSLAANTEFLYLTGTANLSGTGNALANRLYGNSGDNILTAGDGADRLEGGAGADSLRGGLGDDTYYLDNIGDRITEYADEGRDIVYSSVTYTLSPNVEELRLTGTASVTGAGNALDNRIYGNDGDNLLVSGEGNDWLYGGLGADTMRGGAGNDTYFVDNVADYIREYVGEGTDSVLSSITHALEGNIENMNLTGSAAIDGTGNSLANSILGNAADNVLSGGGGADRLNGAGGDDTLYGGAGADQLTGGDGADTFLYKAVADSAGADIDVITDFNPLVDVIDINLIDANTALAGNQAFAWVADFTGHAGEAMWSYNPAADTTTLALDVNGDGVADFKLAIEGQLTGDGGFLL